jgi:hypothetical protein
LVRRIRSRIDSADSGGGNVSGSSTGRAQTAGGELGVCESGVGESGVGESGVGSNGTVVVSGGMPATIGTVEAAESAPSSGTVASDPDRPRLG